MNIFFNFTSRWDGIFSLLYEHAKISPLLFLLFSYNVIAQTPFGCVPSTDKPLSTAFGDINVESGMFVPYEGRFLMPPARCSQLLH